MLRRRNEELEKEKAVNEKERENLLATVEQLRSKLTQVKHLFTVVKASYIYMYCIYKFKRVHRLPLNLLNTEIL